MGLPIVRLVLSFFFSISVTINVYMLVLIRNYRLVLIRKHYVFFVIYDLLYEAPNEHNTGYVTLQETGWVSTEAALIV